MDGVHVVTEGAAVAATEAVTPTVAPQPPPATAAALRTDEALRKSAFRVWVKAANDAGGLFVPVELHSGDCAGDVAARAAADLGLERHRCALLPLTDAEAAAIEEEGGGGPREASIFAAKRPMSSFAPIAHGTKLLAHCVPRPGGQPPPHLHVPAESMTPHSSLTALTPASADYRAVLDALHALSLGQQKVRHVYSTSPREGC